MEKIEIILDNYSQKARDAALDAALESENSTLIELAFKLKPDLSVIGGKLLNYAIKNGNIELLMEILMVSEIVENQQINDEAVKLVALSERTDWFDTFVRLIEKGANKDVALMTLFESSQNKDDAIMWLIEHGAKAYIQTMHVERNFSAIEKIFKSGYGKSIQFSDNGLEVFCNNVCKNRRIRIVKQIVKDRPDLIDKLTQIAVKGGFPEIVKTLHQVNAITSIDDSLFKKAIYKSHFVTVKYLVENGIHILKLRDILDATAYGCVRMMLLLIEKYELQEKKVDSNKYEKVIEIACISNRADSAVAFFEMGYTCDFDANIKKAASYGYIRIVNILLQYSTILNGASFDEAIELARKNEHTETAKRMQAYRRKNPNKFK